jgi:nucleotide-binding universal stress UspA family protein
MSMTILIAYDGSQSADAAIAFAAKLFDHDHADAVVLSVWEPLTVQALRAMRFGGSAPPIPVDVDEVDDNAEAQARRLAEHGARLAGEAGLEARALWAADERRIADTIVESADELDADLIVMGERGLAGLAAFFGSVSNHVLQHASRPVLVVPERKAGTADALDEKRSDALA